MAGAEGAGGQTGTIIRGQEQRRRLPFSCAIAKALLLPRCVLLLA